MNERKVLLILCGICATLSACGVSINGKHPSLQDINEDTGTANVYFIRPISDKLQRLADKTISVGFKNQKLLDIAEGHYTLLRIRPNQGNITTHSKTKFADKNNAITVTRSRSYNFMAGRTYFIFLKRINEGFRGVFFDPAPISHEQAKSLVADIRPYGQARSARIEDIEIVPVTPEQGLLKPVLPEKIYPQSPYILKTPKKQ